MFVQRGALVNLATNTQGYTPLHLAVKHQRQEVGYGKNIMALCINFFLLR